jgi:hypothetical protein
LTIFHRHEKNLFAADIFEPQSPWKIPDLLFFMGMPGALFHGYEQLPNFFGKQ